MPLPSTKVNIPKVQTEDRNTNQLQQNLIDGISKLQQQIRNLSTSIGQSISAYVTESQFQADWGEGWVLQDGRNVAGSAYAKLTGNNTIPDARATVLRMKDNGAGLNPDGDLALGSYQADEFASHVHAIATSVAGTDGGFIARGSVTAAGATATEATGGNETRAKSTTCNFFIRID